MLSVDQFLRLMCVPAVVPDRIADFGRGESAADHCNGQ